MKRHRVPGIIDLVQVRDPREIEAVANDPRIDREFNTRTCPVNWLLLKRSLGVLSVGGFRFPTMISRHDAKRGRDQADLWAFLNGQAANVITGPEELEPLAEWVRGIGSDAQLGMIVQRIVGRLFFKDFIATEESWEAARILVAAPRSGNWPRVLWWFLTGKVRRSKQLLNGMVKGNLQALNAVGIAVHNLVKSFHHMRLLYSDVGIRAQLSGDAAAKRCLFAPLSIYRQATTAGDLAGCAFSRNSLFVLDIGEASRRNEGRSLVFMDNTWSRCPAASWVPAMLEGVWIRARTASNVNLGGRESPGHEHIGWEQGPPAELQRHE